MRWKVSRLEFTLSAGRRLPVLVRRRKGTRHMRLGINVRNEVVVSLPWHGTDRACQKFIEQNRAWLERQIHAVPEVTGLGEWLRHKPSVSAGGRRLELLWQPTSGSRGRYRIDEPAGRAVFYLPDGAGDDVLYPLVRRFAKSVLGARASGQAERLGLHFRGLSVRDQSSRWGSCSSKGTISLNWRLVLLPPALQDYIILHELAHLREMNHSPRFWALLERYDPERRTHEKQLDALAPEIMRVRGPST
jgi:predicted metal-dependent hydrolase